MPRAKGTYVTLDRWVFELAPKLPGAAGVILERLSSQSNYKQKSLTVGQLCHALPFKERAVQNAIAYLVAKGYAEAHADTYCLRQPSASKALATRTDVREGQTANAVPAQESEELNPAIEVHNKKEEKESKEEKASKLEEDQVTPDAFPPAGQPVQDSTPESLGADAPTADAADQASLSPELSNIAQAILETRTPPVGVNTSRAAPRAELPSVPLTPAAAFFTEVTGAFFAKVQAQHLARWHGQYSAEFIVLAWKFSALEERPTYAFADWLDRRPAKPWPDALRRRYELDVDPTFGQEVPAKPRELPVKPGDLVRWADGETATVERCERVDFVTDHEDDARGYVPYSAIGRSVEVLHS